MSRKYEKRSINWKAPRLTVAERYASNDAKSPSDQRYDELFIEYKKLEVECLQLHALLHRKITNTSSLDAGPPREHKIKTKLKQIVKLLFQTIP